MQISPNAISMNDCLMLVESLDKDWEDSDSEQQDVGETDPLEASPKKTENNSEEIKEETFEAVDPHVAKSVDSLDSPKSSDIDETPAESFKTNESYPLMNEESTSCPGIDLPGTEPQRFLVQFNADDEITLTPDDSIPTKEIVTFPANAIENPKLLADMPVIFASVINQPDVSVGVDGEVGTPPADVIDRPEISADMPEIFPLESKQPQISVKKKKVIKPRERVVRKKNTVNPVKKQKLENENASNVIPSVYSYSEIKRHKKRLTLKALQDDSSSDSGSESSEGNFIDTDLDVNLRIIEGSSNTSVENVVIGEIHCDVVADNKENPEITSEKQNKNTNIFKLSVNADFSENSQNKKTPNKTGTEICFNDDEDADDIFDDDDDVNGLCSLYDDDFFSDDDSDLEILTSKSIVRKKSSLNTLKKEKPTESDKKTMYDLIFDSMQPAPRQKDKSNDLKSKAAPKKRASKKSQTKKKEEEKNSAAIKDDVESDVASVEVNAEELDGTKDETKDDTANTTNEALPVPQLKINADGQVIIDTDSLTIEQTGVAEARQAIANSEVVEQTGLNYRSFSKKSNFRKQWSPHDTLKFYDVLSVVGTDFTLMATLFPGRTRNCIKRKYKREEKTNRDLIMKALTCKQKFNIGLLEKELKVKEEKVNLLKINAKKEKQEKLEKNRQEKIRLKKAAEPKVKIKAPSKRKSFFERGISCFQES